ncbi:hypothetical protein D3C80_746800 [compost metagenome]
MQRLDCLWRGLFNRVGNGDHRRQTTVYRSIKRALALLTETLGGRQETGHVQAELRHEAVGSNGDGSAADLG